MRAMHTATGSHFPLFSLFFYASLVTSQLGSVFLSSPFSCSLSFQTCSLFNIALYLSFVCVTYLKIITTMLNWKNQSCFKWLSGCPEQTNKNWNTFWVFLAIYDHLCQKHYSKIHHKVFQAVHRYTQVFISVKQGDCT